MDDLISRQAAIDAILHLTTFASVRELYEYVQTEMWCGGIYDAIDAVIAVPSAQPEQSEVEVSAIAVEEMLTDLLPERGMWEIEGDEAKTAICEVIRDAIEGLWKLPLKPNSIGSSLTQKAVDNDLPSAQPERKTGQWIFHETQNDRYDDMICPFCKKTYTVDAYKIDDIGFTAEDFNYCPNCGSYNGGDSDE